MFRFSSLLSLFLLFLLASSSNSLPSRELIRITEDIKRSRNLLAVTKNSGSFDCREVATRDECVLNPKCKWCQSENIDDMCFSASEAWRLPKQVFAEVIATYFMIFAGCGSVAVNLSRGSVSFPGICVVWGLVVMVMIYSVGHISGAHFNPAVTLAFAINKSFPWKQVPGYISAQILGSTLASATLRLLFDGKREHYWGTIPTGSNLQSLVLEFIISFYLMFVVSGVATDSRAIGELAGLVVGATVMLNVFFAGPISGASMNPARSLGPAITTGRFEGIWVYIVGPICGTVMGSFAYNLIRSTDRPTTKMRSFLKSLRKNSSH